MRFEIQVSSMQFSAGHPDAPNGRTFYGSLTFGRRTLWIQRWANMPRMKPEQARLADPIDRRMVWGFGRRTV